MINTGCFLSGVNCSMYERRLTNRYVTLGGGVIGRGKYEVFPLRGKLLNVREASHKQVRNTGGDRAR